MSVTLPVPRLAAHLPFAEQPTGPSRQWVLVVASIALAHGALLWSLPSSPATTLAQPLAATAGVAVTWVPLNTSPARAEPLPQAAPAPTPLARPSAVVSQSKPQPLSAPTAAGAVPAPVVAPATTTSTATPAPSPTAAPVTAAAAAPTQPEAASPQPAPSASPRPDAAPSFDAAYLDNPRPPYPSVSRIEGEQGTVILRVHVLPTGLADRVEINTSSSHDRLDKAARSAVARWRFVPARSGDQAVAAWVQVPIVFSLQKAQP